MRSKIIFSRAGVEIVTKPFLVGKPLEKLAQEASADFVRDLLADSEVKLAEPCVSLEILNGGHYYFVKPAFEEVTGRECKLASLRAKRGQDEATGDWKVRIWERSGEAMTGGTLLIGDTVATGTTLAGVLAAVVDEMDAAGSHQDVIVFSIAGSPACEPKLAAVDERLAAKGKSLLMVYANCKFNLASNGTDLGFVGAEYNEEAKALIDAQLDGFDAAKMKCAVFDWGDRFRLIPDHIKEVSEYFETVEGVPAWITDGLRESAEAAAKDAGEAAATSGGGAGSGGSA